MKQGLHVCWLSGLTSAVNLRDQNGMAPLHWAILGGYGAIVEILLRNDAGSQSCRLQRRDASAHGGR
jgi:ankyrin repeat protein